MATHLILKYKQWMKILGFKLKLITLNFTCVSTASDPEQSLWGHRQAPSLPTEQGPGCAQVKINTNTTPVQCLCTFIYGNGNGNIKFLCEKKKIKSPTDVEDSWLFQIHLKREF